MEPDLKNAIEMAQFNKDYRSRKLILLMDSRPSEELLRLIPSGGEGIDVILVVFGEHVISSYEITELEKKFKVLVVKDDDLVSTDKGSVNPDGIVGGDQVPLDVVDAVKSMHLNLFFRCCCFFFVFQQWFFLLFIWNMSMKSFLSFCHYNILLQIYNSILFFQN